MKYLEIHFQRYKDGPNLSLNNLIMIILNLEDENRFWRFWPLHEIVFSIIILL